MDTTYEFVTVTCLYCDAERTVGKRVESDLPEWVCGPCKRELNEDNPEWLRSAIRARLARA